MASRSGVAVAGLIVGLVVVTQAGGSEGDGEGITDTPSAVESADPGPEGDTGDDGDAEVPLAVEGGLATIPVDDLGCPSVVCCGGHVR